MELFNPDFGLYIAIFIAFICALLPLAVGIPLCLKNTSLSPLAKAGWCLVLLSFGLIGLFAYLIIYRHPARN